MGFQKVETNARGRVMRVLERTDPRPGSDIVLHLDLRLQQITEKLLEGRRASVVAIDPKTGGILTMVSTPAYDPNMFVTESLIKIITLCVNQRIFLYLTVLSGGVILRALR